jgi:glycerol-3-phosphate dehydrogenase (NAD(P)+)
MNLAIFGAGAWGTALAIALGAAHNVMLWGRDPKHIENLSATRTNRRYLPGYTLPSAVTACANLAQALAQAELVLLISPTSGLRPLLEALSKAGLRCPVIWGCKGFESGTHKLPHEIARAVVGTSVPLAVLSGPSFAQEVAAGKPAALTLASSDRDFAVTTARALHTQRLRVYSSDDVIGVEVGGAVKNVMAIAVGICDGMDLGNNARAALITRGLAEISRLGLRLGGRSETFTGLTGLGDLVLTCTGDLSRNRQVGLQLARGEKLDAILQRLGHVAEGVYTTKEVTRLAGQLGVDMPIANAVHRVLYDQAAPAYALQELLNREPKAEH